MNRQMAILTMEYAYEAMVFRVLFAALGVVLIAYSYFVGASVLNIIARKEADRSSSSLQGSIATMEKQYFALSQAVTPDTGEALGLSPVQATDYVYRPGATAAAETATMDRTAI